ncbi:hypothetical protein PIB30_082881 [Stylosanthes scabra]|uniref:Uncharacterized protein n=1 Tax=Stylosanthes scabra TaxID=79078 RepID=A0ABU6YSG0_9FABA|nr:hypothetical protein [Stylosanthes scabra]
MPFGCGSQSLKRVLIHYYETSKSLSEPTTFSTYDASAKNYYGWSHRILVVPSSSSKCKVLILVVLQLCILIGSNSASHLRVGQRNKMGNVSSRVDCLSAPDDYSEEVQAWFLTSEFCGNPEATHTALLGTFRSSLADLEELVRISSP